MCCDAPILDIAYPPPDAVIRDYLQQTRPSLEEYQISYLLLLGYLFKAVSGELITLYRRNKEPTYGALAKAWRKYMEEGSNRTRIYERAVNRCNSNELVCPLFIGT